MASFLVSAFLPPFLLTCALPGILLALIFAKKEKMDASLFFVWAAILGIASQIAIGTLVNVTAWIPIVPITRVGLIGSLFVATCAGALYKKRGDLPRITVGAYDIAAFGIAIALVAFVRSHATHLPSAYFNPSSDQYYWLAFGEMSLHDAMFALVKIFTSQLHRPLFFLMLAPYVAFIPKGMEGYQNFMLLWTCGIYGIISVGIARLAYATLPVRTFGLMAAPALFALHWYNYYTIGAGIVPQGIGLFLLIAGFLLIAEDAPLPVLWIFLAVFYAIHLGTLVIFALVVGTARIVRTGSAYLWSGLSRKKKTVERWHLFEKLFFLPAVIGIFLYGLNALHVLPQDTPAQTAYYEEYSKNLSLFTQPYVNKEQMLILWTGALGAMLALVMRENVTVAFGFILPWTFLMTPFVAYQAFHASWQSFRYYLLFYPSIVIMGLAMPGYAALILKRTISFRAGAALSVVITVGMLPILLSAAFSQQGFVFKDMIEGHDKGVQIGAQKAKLEELLGIRGLLPENGSGPVLFFQNPDMDPTHIYWAFAPRETLAIGTYCAITNCPVTNRITSDFYDFFDIAPDMIVIPKGMEISPLEKTIVRAFPATYRSDSFMIYTKR